MSKLRKQVETFNKYSSDHMLLIEKAEEYFELQINDTVITVGDYNDIYDRIRGINRENGYTYLEEW